MRIAAGVERMASRNANTPKKGSTIHQLAADSANGRQVNADNGVKRSASGTALAETTLALEDKIAAMRIMDRLRTVAGFGFMWGFP